MSQQDSSSSHIQDSHRDNWVNRCPAGLQPWLQLMRLDRPVGIWLLLWPALWSVALADRQFQFLYLYPIFAIGAVVMRAAGCIINDMADRKYDSQVERTRNRPLASGRITMMQAAVLLIVLLLIGLAILLSLPKIVVVMGVIFMGMIIVYPFMKRITWWPQAFLGLTFNAGALMGWGAVTGNVSWSAVCLYVAGFFWTLGYDTIYAHQDKQDDVLLGLKSTALCLGNKTRFWVAGFYDMAWLFVGIAGYLLQMDSFFYVVLSVAVMHFIWQVYQLDIDNGPVCLNIFKSNIVVGCLIWLAIMIGQLQLFWHVGGNG